MQTRTQGFAPLSTRSLSLHGCISARVSPTYNLTVRCNYSQRSAYVEFPCGGLAFRLSLQYASDTYSYHTYCMPTVKRTRRSGQSSVFGTYLMIKNTVLTKTFQFGLDITAHNSENRVQVQKPLGEIITVAKPYDLRYSML